jgi:hypothetical protein
VYVSGIARSTFYSHSHSDTEFMDKIALARVYATERAKQVVIQAIDKGDIKAAQWWLERKLRAEFSANPPSHVQKEDVSMVDQYFDGDQDKFLDFMQRNINALREVPSKAE